MKKQRPEVQPPPGHEHKKWSAQRFLFSPIFWLFLAGLALRLAHLFLYKDDFWLRTPLLDDNIFVSWADTIAREGWMARSLGIFDFNPAYSYFLAFAGKLIGRGPVAVFALQHIFGALAPVLLYVLCKRLFDQKTALVAGVIGVLYGPSFFYESRFLGEFWIYFFNLALLVCLAIAWRRENPAPAWGLAGLSLGLSAIFRPNVLAFVPVALAWGVWSLKKRPRVMAMSLALYVLGLWLPMIGFQMRNRAIDPSWGWGLTTSSGGVNFYLGNNPEADGLNKAPSFVRYGPGHEYQDFKKEAELRTGRTLGPREVSRYWTRRALKWFRNRPKAAARLIFHKAGFFWNHRQPPDNFFLEIFKRFTSLGGIRLVNWGLVAPLGLAGLLWSLAQRPGRSFWPLHAYVATYFAVNVAFYILSRYRFPTVAGLIPFAAYAMVEFYRNWRASKRSRAWALAFLFLPCIALSRLPLIGEENKAVTHYSMGVIYANQGWKDKAVKEYLASIKADPSFKASYLNLGILQANRGNLRQAIWALEGTLRLETDPGQISILQLNIRRLKAQQ